LQQYDENRCVYLTRIGRHSKKSQRVAGPTVWNSLPDHLRDPVVDSEQYQQFRRSSKTYLFAGHLKR